MHRLKDAYGGRRGVVIFGGPSLVADEFDFGWLRGRDFVTFLDTKALTPYFVKFGVEPDYLFMPFPEKGKGNALQDFVFRSFLANVDIRPFLKATYRVVVDDMRAHFAKHFEPWQPEKGPHKRYRWKDNVYLKDSPVDLLKRVPGTRIIANLKLLRAYFSEFAHQDRCYSFQPSPHPEPFSLERYYTLLEEQGTILLRNSPFLNSAAIAHYRLLSYMGFREVYLLGMDMSMLGTLEYAVPYTFRSMWHFRWFFRRAQRAFNANYRPNRPFYLRPRSEFEDLRMVLNGGPVRFIRVFSGYRYAGQVDGILTISMEEFLRLG